MRNFIKKRELVPGDVIKTKYGTATIKEIFYQEPFEWRNGYYCEFEDTDGKYRTYNHNFDGGICYDCNGIEI